MSLCPILVGTPNDDGSTNPRDPSGRQTRPDPRKEATSQEEEALMGLTWLRVNRYDIMQASRS
jgi:hypothetical protein